MIEDLCKYEKQFTGSNGILTDEEGGEEVIEEDE